MRTTALKDWRRICRSSLCRWALVLALIVPVSLLFFGGRTTETDIIRFGVASAALDLDPRFATDATAERLDRLFYQRLVRLDDKGMPQPAIADWTMPSPDHYRFVLNRRAGRFPDGRRLDAFDVAATFRYVLDARNASPHRAAIDMIERVETPDARTIDFHLSRPDPLFPAYLELSILPADRLEQGHDFARMPFGSGPFRYLGAPAPGRLLMRRIRDGQRFEIVEVRNPTVRVLKLLRGEIDLLQSDLSPELLGYLGAQPGIRLIRRPGSNFGYIGFNLRDPAIGKARVRRAIAHAIDRRSIIDKVLRGAAREAETLFPPEHWAGNDSLQAYPFDPGQARRLLREAGYGPDNPLTLVYKTSSDPFRIRLATIIQSQLHDVGIEVDLRSYDWGTFFGDIKAGNFQFYSLNWVGVRTPDILRYIFASDALPPAGANRGRYASPVVDALLKRAAGADTLRAQAGLYRRIEAVLHEDLPYLPLWYEDQYAALNHRVVGYRVSADGNFDGLNDIELTANMEPSHATAPNAH
ncbi:MAG: ABC transporter substrate-binding protein [Candidatus Thiodiazotropha sp.]